MHQNTIAGLSLVFCPL